MLGFWDFAVALVICLAICDVVSSICYRVRR